MPFGALSIKPQRPKLEDTEPPTDYVYVPNLVDAIPLCLCGAWAPPIQRLRLLERMGRAVSAPTATEDKWNHQQAFWTRGNPWDQNPRRAGGEPQNSSASPTPEASL